MTMDPLRPINPWKAIAFALDRVDDHFDRAEFLRAVQHNDQDTLRAEWPDFEIWAGDEIHVLRFPISRPPTDQEAEAVAAASWPMTEAYEGPWEGRAPEFEVDRGHPLADIYLDEHLDRTRAVLRVLVGDTDA